MEHHVHVGIGPSGPVDVVLPDEEIRDCGERSTTSHRRRRIGLQRLGARETKDQDFAGFRAPTPAPKAGEQDQRLGAKETKEQGFAGVFAPSPRGWCSEKGQGLGAKETKEQGFAGVFAPSPKGWSSEKDQRLGARETKKQGFAGIRAPSPKPRSGAPPKPDAENPLLGTPPTQIPYFLAMKEAAVPSAQRLLPYIMLFWGCKFKGEARAARQRPTPLGSASPSSAKPTPSGSASQVRQRLAGPAAPSPHRRSLLIGEACASRAYIGRLGMRTVKVVPSPGMLST